jgi:hypothetical protein
MNLEILEHPKKFGTERDYCCRDVKFGTEGAYCYRDVG